MAVKKRYKTNIKPAQVERWLKTHFPNYKRKSKGRQAAINNPFEHDTGYHMWINLQPASSKTHDSVDYFVHDWRSKQYNMTFVSFVKKYRKISFFEALREITGSNKRTLRRELKDEEEQEDVIEKIIQLPDMSQSFKDTMKNCDKQYIRVRKKSIDYLKSRAITEDRAIEQELYFTPTTIVFPYIEYGELVYWQERSILGKRFNFPDEKETGLSKTNYLYNFDNVEQPNGTVIIVESIINSISIGEGCVATGGAVISTMSKQLLKIVSLRPKMVILAPDFDKAGIDSMIPNYIDLKKQMPTCLFGLCVPPVLDLDWNDMDRQNGAGYSRKYIQSNSKTYDVKYVMSLRSRFR